MKSKRSKACDIKQSVKEKVWERDGHRCIFCGSSSAMPNAHFVPRSKSGLGIEQNIVTACKDCHHKMDQTKYRKEMLKKAKEHLQASYPDWDETKLQYDKWGWMHHE